MSVLKRKIQADWSVAFDIANDTVALGGTIVPNTTFYLITEETS